MPNALNDPLIQGYLSYLEKVRRLNPRTLIDLKCTLRKVGDAMGNLRPSQDLWELSLNDFVRWTGLERQQGSTAKSIAKRLSHVRGLLEYAWKNGRSDRNVLDGFHLQDEDKRTPPRVLTLAEAQTLIEACPRDNAENRKKRAMILLLYGCGLRTQELCNLNTQDINHERQEIFIRQAKGDIQRWIPVPAGVWTELLAYLAERKATRGALFRTNAKNRRIRSNHVLSTVKEAVLRGHLSPDITPRTLRHTFATHLMDAGVDLSVISTLMGHRTPTETGVYLHALPGCKEEAVKKIKIISNIKEALK